MQHQILKPLLKENENKPTLQTEKVYFLFLDLISVEAVLKNHAVKPYATD